MSGVIGITLAVISSTATLLNGEVCVRVRAVYLRKYDVTHVSIRTNKTGKGESLLRIADTARVY